MRRLLGFLVENYEPIAWAEELIEPARAVDHPRLAVLYVMASQCFVAGRLEAAVGYSDAAQTVLGNGRDEVPYGIEGWVGGAYVYIGQPERCVEWCRAQLARGRDTHTLARAFLVIALKIAGSEDEAMAATKGLIDAAEATANPYVISFALMAYGFAFLDADPDRAREAMLRGVLIAQDSGNRTFETYLASNLAGLEAQHGDPLAALNYFLVTIRHLHDSGNSTTIRAILATLAALFNRLGHDEVAATMSGFADIPYTRSVVPEISTAIIHLRKVLGDETYESLARRGEQMTTATMVTYALDQIDETRTELNAVSK